MPRVRAAVLATLLIGPAAQAAQPQFWEVEGASEFLNGDLQGLSVDSNGRVRLAPAAPVLHNPSAPYVWALARHGTGAIYAGTGNDGRVYRIVGEEASLFFDAPELEVHALAVDGKGHVYVGSSPDGKVYEIDAEGEAKALFDPEERYIWALAFDKKGRLLVATGDAGKVYRVEGGKSEAILDGPEGHITALTVDDAGRVYAGSSPGGIVYRIEADGGKVFVLQDTAYREVKSIALGPDGAVYAAVLEGQETTTARPAPAVIPTASPVTGATAEITVTETLVGLFPMSPTTPTAARTIETPRPGQAKGAVLKLLPSGETDTLWASSEEMPYALLRRPDGLLLGTGGKGKLYRIEDDRTWTMLTALPVEQITTLGEGAKGNVVIGTSNPGTVYRLGGGPGASGTFLSKVKDTDTVSSWGRLRWHAEAPDNTEVRLATRSGNTGTPDNTWSDWSTFYSKAAGDAIGSPGARFLQVKAVLDGKNGTTPVLDSIRAAYLQRNLRPQVTSVTVHPPGEVFQKPLSLSGETEILGFEAPPSDSADQAAAARFALPATTYSRKLQQKGLQTFSWKAEDPNGDGLVYDLEYRPLHETRFRSLRKGLEESVLVWDTATVPNGRYVVRVVARDSPANPDALALAGDKESAPFNVDNTPPTVTASAAKGGVRATARDDSSMIRKAEYSLDGGRWEEIHPADGINDSVEEVYEFSPRGLGDGPHVVVVRATDLLGNVSTARVEIK